jgi:transcriptional regulator with XRE-family HTH domain
MGTIIERMTLKELLIRHNVLAPSELRRRIPSLSTAHASNLWNGKSGVGKETMRLLHERLGISYDELMEVDPVGKQPPKTPSAGTARRRSTRLPPKQGGGA